MDKYIIITWPESQDFIGRKNCHLINDDEGYMKYGSSAYFVREDIYQRVMFNLQHPRLSEKDVEKGIFNESQCNNTYL